LSGDEERVRAFIGDKTREQLLQLVDENEIPEEALTPAPGWLMLESVFFLLVRELDCEVLTAMLSSHCWGGWGGSGAVSCAARGGYVAMMMFLVCHPALGVEALLASPRLLDGDHWIPVSLACLYNHLPMVEWMLAVMPVIPAIVECLREGLLSNGFSADAGIRELVADYIWDPAAARRYLRLGQHLTNEEAAGLFALLVFLCDGFLQFRHPHGRSQQRFLGMGSALPIELQMRLCHMAAGSDPEASVILAKDSEPAFRALALSFAVE